MFTPLRQAQDTNNKQRTNVYGFFCVSWTVSAATVCTVSSRVERRKRGSTAVPKTSKKGEERFYNYYNAVRLPICIVAIVHLLAIVHLKQCTIVGRALPIYL